MADKLSNMKRLEDCGIVAVVRIDDSQELIKVCNAVLEGGVDCLEITMTTPNALGIISDVSKEIGDKILLGVGTVLDPETARAALLAGAQFVVSPALNLDVVKMCRRYSKVVIPGAFTPTEIIAAWESGADYVKVFPATTLGPGYFKDIKAPLPQIKLVPTGGVTLDTTADFIKAGASFVAAGSNLVEKQAVKEGNLVKITKNAARFREEVLKGRSK